MNKKCKFIIITFFSILFYISTFYSFNQFKTQNQESTIVKNIYNKSRKNTLNLISIVTNIGSYNDIVTNLNSFYNTLENSSDYIYSTNKFICEGNNLNCTGSSKFSNIGLINVDEYNRVGGLNSYLGSNSSYFSMTERNNLVSNITSSGIEEVEYDTSSGIRGVVYVQSDVRVIGSGTASDPYVFTAKGDINIIGWTLDGISQTGNIPGKTDGYQVEGVTCTNGATGEWNNDTWGIIIGNITDIPTNCTINFKTPQYLYAQILADNPNIETRSDFSTIFTESNNGNTIYRATGQDNKTTYYFAGTVTNNYVKFANKYWRIVRINEDNSVRLIYAGLDATDTAAFISTSQAYNSNSWNSAYVGYMYTASEQYGTGTNSDVKTVVDNWYSSNLNSYSGYISKTAIYCNDRTVGSGSWSATGSSFDYAAYTRLNTNKTPTFACSNSNDRFTASTSTGNGKLTYPIGLITADEVSYAGGYTENNSNYYIAQNASSGASYWWTMSPNNWNSDRSELVAGVFMIGGASSTGYLSVTYVYRTYGVRPVISLKSCVLASGGDGTADNPYEVGLADGCANVENEILEENTVRVSATTNDASMATVNAPSSVIINSGSSHTFTLTVKDGYEYESVTGCNGTYDTSTNQLTVSNVTSSITCQVNFTPPREPAPLYSWILEDNPNVSTRSSFSAIFTTSNNGNTIYSATGQDNKTTYYFAGQVTNNYVKFADKYWRIVRINEDNSVRLIYAGTSASDTAAFISTSQKYNSSWNNSAYVGYMYTASQQYGTGTNSPIKTTIDNWYASNLNSYSGYISKTAIYCNDRTVGSGTWSATGSTFDYDAYTRLYTNKTPTFTCSNANDRFTSSTTTGNGKLTYPIGLITADEISYAGGLWATNNSNYYIAQNASSGAGYWWTMSPRYWNGHIAFVFIVGGSANTGRLNGSSVDGSVGVRPVISLKSCVLASGGNGTASDPYTVELPSACSSAEN